MAVESWPGSGGFDRPEEKCPSIGRSVVPSGVLSSDPPTPKPCQKGWGSDCPIAGLLPPAARGSASGGAVAGQAGAGLCGGGTGLAQSEGALAIGSAPPGAGRQRGGHLSLSFLPPQQAGLYERGRDLFTFLTVASSHIMRTLQRPRRSRPGKRRVNHRRFLHNQISRQFADIEAATRRLASSILAQEAPREPMPRVEPRCLGPAPPAPAANVFLGVAEAFVAPEPGPGWGLSVASTAPDPSDLFDPIIGPEDPGLPPGWAPITHNSLGSSQSPLPWDPLPWDPLPPPGTEAAPLWAPGPPGYVPHISPGYPDGAAAPGRW
ncbi:uncharacterized protein C19orf85 homolog [Emydura macquarii macquarii]|uniref:uncharacterized protein C19orf85 homolog n=1 Tax=Emydura macquarii macquarii TaxID=1129001 RepID=UPI00352AB489